MAQKQQSHHHQQIRQKHYSKSYWCDFCCKYIPKNKVVWSKKKIRTFPTCPKPNCNGNRLKTQSTNYKYKSKEAIEYRNSKEY